MKPSTLVLAIVTAAGALTAPLPAVAQQRPEVASHPYGASRPVPDRYIVVLKNAAANSVTEAARLTQAHGGRLHHSYTAAIKGFAAYLPAQALEALRKNPEVAFIEQDQTVSLQQSYAQDQATWGLDRVDQADRPLDTRYTFTNTASGVHAFIIDSGIRSDHVEFAGRIQPGAEFVGDGGGTNDCNGHGSHVAGTVAGSTWGVAKGAFIVPVRVLDCGGTASWSAVIAAIDWVANHPQRPAVANLSLGGAASAAVDAAVAGAVAKGVVMVVAAGNSNADACAASPAREPSALTVGATTTIDYRASFSNWGPCVDLFAPGGAITSAGNGSADASIVMSGTSMAAPHVTGIVALALSANPEATPASISQLVLSGATRDRIVPLSLGAGSPNLLAYSLLGGTAVQPAATTAAIKAISGSATRTGGNWKASAVIAVRNVETGSGVPNATVTVTFSPGGQGSCITGSDGSCSLSSSPIKNNAGATSTLVVNDISGSNLVYAPGQNTVSQIVISKP